MATDHPLLSHVAAMLDGCAEIGQYHQAAAATACERVATDRAAADEAHGEPTDTAPTGGTGNVRSE